MILAPPLAGPVIESLRWKGEAFPVRAVAEATVELRALYDDPFDPEQVRLDATIVDPDGRTITLPGFVFQDYRPDGDGLASVGTRGWRVRWSPELPGPHRISLALSDRTGRSVFPETVVVATPSDEPGFVGLDPRDPRQFAERGTGRPVRPVGASEVDDLAALGAAGGDWARVPLAPGGSAYGFEVAGKRNEGRGAGRYDLAKLWRLDQAVAQARAGGVRLQLALQMGAELREGAEWDRSALNLDNGGPLRSPGDYWSSEDADRLFRRKLRYLVGRYAADPAVFAWEFWFQADRSRDYDAARVRDWHRKMGRELARLDPYRHLRTTSFAKPTGERDVDTLPELDFVQTHIEGAPDPVGALMEQTARKTSWNKAHLSGLVAADRDADGLLLHDPLWASLATGMAGGAMARDADPSLFPLLTAARRFLAGIDAGAEGFRLARPVLTYTSKPTLDRARDLAIPPGPRSFGATAYNRPTRVLISPKGIVTGGVVSGFLQGRRRPFVQNPVRFVLDLPRPTTMEIVVGEVSGEGGAGLEVELDGSRILRRVFADPDGDRTTTPRREYAGKIALPLPKGSHVVTVTNPGADWLAAEYRFRGLLATRRPPLDAWGAVGERTVTAWIRPSGRIWRAVAVERRAFPPFVGATLAMPGLASGNWRVEFWDTRKGAVQSSRTVDVPLGGTLRTPLPPIGMDLAMRAVKLPYAPRN